MTDKLKNRLKLGGVIALALLIGGLATAKASSYWDWSEIKGLVADRIASKVDAPVVSESQAEPIIGAVSGPALPNPFCQNGECTWTVSQNWQHGTNTIFSVLDPFQQTTSTGGVTLFNDGIGHTGASTTVSLVRIYQTAQVTSTFGIACGPATGPNGAAIESAKAIVSTTVALVTSSLGVLENNVTAAQGARLDGGTVNKVMMGPQDPYFVCKADVNADGVAGVSNGDSTGTGKIYIRFNRSQI